MTAKNKIGMNPDRFLAKTLREKKLSRAGVPSYLWTPKAALVKCTATQNHGAKLSGTALLQWIKTLTKNPPRRAPILAVSSTPTDLGALHLAYLIMNVMLTSHEKSVASLNMAEEMPGYFESRPDCVVLHNILKGATAARKQMTRDVLLRFWFSFRIVVLAGTDNPEKWMLENLAMVPDLAVHVKDLKRKDLTAE